MHCKYSRPISEAEARCHEAEIEGRKSEAEDDAQNSFSRPRPQCLRPRPNTLENNSVCMSMKTKLLVFTT